MDASDRLGFLRPTKKLTHSTASPVTRFHKRGASEFAEGVETGSMHSPTLVRTQVGMGGGDAEPPKPKRGHTRELSNVAVASPKKTDKHSTCVRVCVLC